MFGNIVLLGFILTLAACASPAEKEQLVKKKAAKRAPKNHWR